jgi:para-nitrobenzyl esterase
MARDNTLVEICSGPIRGSDDGAVTSWKGGPNAAPPVGDLRWRAPEPVTPWIAVADATRYGFVCPQPVDPRVPIDLGAHYRIGALGFLDLSEFDSPRRRFDSNLGLRDVLAALRWCATTSPRSAEIPTVSRSSANRRARASSPRCSPVRPPRACSPPRSRKERLPQVPVDVIVAAATDVFYDVPVSNPGTLAFAPIVDGDVVPDYPVKLAREGRSHPVPLIIGTNKHEAALFKWMNSPLMPITPEAINAMFTEIAAEQPTLELPTEDKIGTT